MNGLTTSHLGEPDYAKALEQHEQYVNALKKCGVKAIELGKRTISGFNFRRRYRYLD